MNTAWRLSTDAGASSPAYGLPFASALPSLLEALGGRGVAVVEAPPGSGKTTLVPPAVAELAGPGRVVVTQPRRVAARGASRRLAALTGTRVGGLVGHTVRGDHSVSAATRVEFVTPGVLVRRLLSDPELPGVAAVVLDEVHERHLESDLAIGMVTELRQLRDDLLVVVMSATLDARGFADLVGGDGMAAPVVTARAEPHPLEVRHEPCASPRLDARGVTAGFLDHVAERTVAALRGHDGDALVFVPGVREIERVMRSLAGRVDAEILPLHGGVSAAEQDRAVSGGGRRRVVVSTDVAESSITVPGVRIVVDACLSREPRFDLARGMSGLVTVSASRQSCTQRAGRAARLGPGLAVRCVGEDEFSRLPERRTPAIATSDLVGAALDLACWGTPRGEGLALPDPPPPVSVRRAEDVLRGLGAVDAGGHATDRGRVLARIPADPRLARALLDGAPLVGRSPAAEVVALLASDRRSPAGDLVADLRALKSGRAPDAGAWRAEARRIEGLAPAGGAGSGLDDRPVGLISALAFPDRIAHRRGGQYTFVSGTAASLPPGSPLAGSGWIVAADVARAPGRAGGAAGAVIRSAVAIDRTTAEDAAAGALVEEETAEFSGGALTTRRVRRIGAIELSSTAVPPARESAVRAVVDALRATGLSALGPSDDADRLHRRLSLAHRTLGDPWPAVDGAALADRVEEWLAPEIDALVRGGRTSGWDLAGALRRLLPWPEAGRFDELVPDRVRVPSGASHRVDHPAPGSDDAPVLAAKLQECFGWTASPTICDGRVAVTVHLLSPAGRPLAVTRDLAFFWQEAYPGVRAEMRGRYPKHPWPEDPLTAEATGRTNSRRTR